MSTRNVRGPRAHASIALPALILVLAIVLSACGGAGVATEPTPGATAEAPAPATATASPAPAPTAPATAPAATATPSPAPPQPTAEAAPPQPGSLLPAALLYLQGGQLYRHEADGVTTTQLTDEPAPAPDAAAITAFDVSPIDGSIAYLVQRPAADGQSVQALILTDADGANGRELLTSAYLTAPRFSPDGARIAFGIVPALGDVNRGPAPGVYLVAVGGGSPELVQPSDSFVTMPAATGARAYAPSGWSPDGTKLLLQAFLPATEFCETAIKDLMSGGLITPQAPQGLSTSCRAVAWSPDSGTFYLPLYEPGMFGAFAGLAQVDPASGQLTVPLSNKVGATWISINGLTALGDGTFRGFVATSATPIAMDPTQPPPLYTLHTITLDGSLTPLSGELRQIWGGPHWAPGGEGAIILSSSDPGGQTELVWVPADGGPAITLAGAAQAGDVRWVKAAPTAASTPVQAGPLPTGSAPIGAPAPVQAPPMPTGPAPGAAAAAAEVSFLPPLPKPTETAGPVQLPPVWVVIGDQAVLGTPGGASYTYDLGNGSYNTVTTDGGPPQEYPELARAALASGVEALVVVGSPAGDPVAKVRVAVLPWQPIGSDQPFFQGELAAGPAQPGDAIRTYALPPVAAEGDRLLAVTLTFSGALHENDYASYYWRLEP